MSGIEDSDRYRECTIHGCQNEASENLVSWNGWPIKACSDCADDWVDRGIAKRVATDGGTSGSDRTDSCDFCYRDFPVQDLEWVYTILNGIEQRERVCPNCEDEAREYEKPVATDGGTSVSYRRAKATYSQSGTLHVMRPGEEATVFPDLSEKLQALCGGWLLGPYLPTEEIGVEKFKRDFCPTCEKRVREWPDDAIPREIRAAWQEQERSLHTDSEQSGGGA